MVSKQLLHVAQKLSMYYNHNVYSSSTTHLKGSCYKTELYLSGLTAALILILHCAFLFHLPLKKMPLVHACVRVCVRTRARACVHV